MVVIRNKVSVTFEASFDIHLLFVSFASLFFFLTAFPLSQPLFLSSLLLIAPSHAVNHQITPNNFQMILLFFSVFDTRPMGKLQSLLSLLFSGLNGAGSYTDSLSEHMLLMAG